MMRFATSRKGASDGVGGARYPAQMPLQYRTTDSGRLKMLVAVLAASVSLYLGLGLLAHNDQGKGADCAAAVCLVLAAVLARFALPRPPSVTAPAVVCLAGCIPASGRTPLAVVSRGSPRAVPILRC